MLLGHIKSTSKYLLAKKIFIENFRGVIKYKGIIVQQSTRKIYEFLCLVVKYYELNPNNCSVIFEVGADLESTGNFKGVSESLTTDESLISDKYYNKLDQAILQTQNILKNSPAKPYTPIQRTPSPFLSCFSSFDEETPKNHRVDALEVKQKLKNYLYRVVCRRPRVNLLACKDKVLGDFEGTLSWGEKKYLKGFRGDAKFRNIVKDVNFMRAKDQEKSF